MASSTYLRLEQISSNTCIFSLKLISAFLSLGTPISTLGLHLQSRYSGHWTKAKRDGTVWRQPQVPGATGLTLRAWPGTWAAQVAHWPGLGGCTSQ